MHRASALEQLALDGGRPVPRWLVHWIRFGIPLVILAVGVYWLLTSVFGTISRI
jgi:hypothetical protein